MNSPLEKIYGRYTDPKWCNGCKESKSLSEFATYRRPTNSGEQRLYYRARCNECEVKSSTKWNVDNRDRANENQRRWYNSQAEVVAARLERENRPPETERLCEKCGEVKPIESFAEQRRVCKECIGEYNERWREQNPEYSAEWYRENGDLHKDRSYHRDYGFGIVTPDGVYVRWSATEEFNRRSKTQNYCCGIDGKPTDKFDVDHDHKNGAVRGLLCHKHNVGLGYFHDDADELMAGAAWVLQSRDLLRPMLDAL